MPRIYAAAEAHEITMGAVDFLNGVAAMPADSDVSFFEVAGKGYTIDENKHALTVFDEMNRAVLEAVCTYLGIAYNAQTAKHTMSRAIETAISTNALGAVVVASAGGQTEPATLTVNIASALLDGGAKDVEVAVLATDNTTSLIAAKIRAALAADTDIATHFVVGGADANIILTAIVEAANDPTLAITLGDADGTTITIGASADTEAGVAPVIQIETVAVTAGAGGAGTLVVNVAAAGLDGGSEAVNVPVTGDDDTPAEVAAKIRAALALDADIAELFTVSGEDANIILTAKEDAANDPTLAITLTAADDTGVTLGASGDTEGGVLANGQIETAAVTAIAAYTHAAIAITGAGTYKYILGDNPATPLYFDDVSAWTDIETGGQIPVANAGKDITVARVNADNLVLALGTAVIAAKRAERGKNMAYEAYIGSNDYTGTYKGIAIDAASFARIALRASDELDVLTLGKVRAAGLASYAEDAQERIKLATCALAEGLAMIDAATDGTGILTTSEKVGSYTYNIDAASLQRTMAQARAKARDYLFSTGLLYRGVVPPCAL